MSRTARRAKPRRLFACLLPLAAILVLGGPVKAGPAQSDPQPSAAANATIVLPFAPSVDRPILLTKRLERHLSFGTIVRTARYRLHFTAMARGYRLHWEQVDNRLEGPPDFLRLAGLGEDLLENETLTISLANDGTILGVTETPGRQQRLQEAIARLKRDPAFTRLPPERQKALTVQIDRIGTMDAAARADWVIAGIAPLFDLAGQTIVKGRAMGRTGDDYLLAEAGDAPLLALTAHDNRTSGTDRAVDRTIQIHVSRDDGLAWHFARQVITSVAGNSQTSDERMTLDEWPVELKWPRQDGVE